LIEGAEDIVLQDDASSPLSMFYGGFLLLIPLS